MKKIHRVLTLLMAALGIMSARELVRDREDGTW